MQTSAASTLRTLAASAHNQSADCSARAFSARMQGQPSRAMLLDIASHLATEAAIEALKMATSAELNSAEWENETDGFEGLGF